MFKWPILIVIFLTQSKCWYVGWCILNKTCKLWNLKKWHNFKWKIRTAVFGDNLEHKQLKVSLKSVLYLFQYIQRSTYMYLNN